MESWGYPSPSSTNTTQSNSKSLEQLKAKEKDSHVVCGTNQAESRNQLLPENENTNVFLFPVKCNGIMGVPITFLDKYNPEQFEISTVENREKMLFLSISGLMNNPNDSRINGKSKYARILIRRKK